MNLCEDEQKAKRVLGSDCAVQLKVRLADLVAVNNVGELKLGGPHPLLRDRKGQFAMRLPKGNRLIFVPEQESDMNESVDWSDVSEIKIIEIGDYHD